MKINISCTINGKEVNTEVGEDLTLLRFLREKMNLMGTKNGCEKGHCGACTLIVNGEARRSCLLKMSKLQGAVIETIEGIHQDEKLHFIQEAFIAEGAVQCGFCTPGMIMAAKALLDKKEDPKEEEIKEALKNNLCRCTGYTSIINAVKKAAVLKKERQQSAEKKTSNREKQSAEELRAFKEEKQSAEELKTSNKEEQSAEKLKTFNKEYIGVSVVKKDAIDKVKGNVVFADDYIEEGALQGKLLFSEHAHARILSIDTTEAVKAPGVVLVLTGKDIPGRNTFGLFYPQQPVIAVDEVKYLGEVVAAVFAETREQAEYGRSLIKVEYEVLTPQLSPIENIKEDAPLIHSDKESNIVHHVKVRKGDVEKGFAEADIVVEGYYSTPAIEHAYLEPEACLARPEADGGVTVWTGNQGSVSFQDTISKCLDIPLEKVRIIYTPCGGGFGGKEEPTVQIHAALGAILTKRPVKIALTREESIRTSTKRHPMHIWMKHGATKDGRMVAMESKVIGDAGAYISLTMPVIFRSAVTASGPYEMEHVKADSYGVYTHNNPGGAFRGFGSTQASFAAEIQMDKIARALNMDPIAIRRLNGFDTGKETSTGQVLKEGVGYLGTLDAVEEKLQSLKQERENKELPAHKKLGIGIASSYKNVGIGTGKPDKAGAIVELLENGRISVRIGATDMGQGSDTIMAQIAATVLSVPYELIDVVACDTETCPDGGMTTASRQTYVTGNAVKQTAEALKEKLHPYFCCGVEEKLLPSSFGGTNKKEINQQYLISVYKGAKEKGLDTLAETYYMPPKTYPHKDCADHVPGVAKEEFDIHYAYCFATTGVLVEVDTLTGEVQVLKALAAQDVGKAIHPQNVKGQIEGAVVMGTGFALTEEFLENETAILTDTLHKLHIPKITEVPEIEAMIVEIGQPEGPYGAKGMGEVGLNPMAPAISNAIFDAVGVRMQHLPMKKEKVLAALKEGKK